MIEPTAILRKLPGLYPDQAADVIAKAIIQRPRAIAPPWVGPVELASVLLAGARGSCRTDLVPPILQRFPAMTSG